MSNTPLSRNAHGQWISGRTPWNKSTSKGGRKHGTAKGHQGFLPRPVLLILPNGTVGARFASVKAAAKHLNRTTSAIVDSCLGRSLCCNRRLVYEEDYVKWADYSYKPHPNRTPEGYFFKGCRNLYRLSPEAQEQKRKRAQIQSAARAKDPNDKWGKGKALKPVECITTGETFPSIKEAAQKCGISGSLISRAISLDVPAHGLKFRKL